MTAVDPDMDTNYTLSPPSIATQWASIRALYPIYAALATQFELGTPPYASVQELGDQSEEEVIANVYRWLSEPKTDRGCSDQDA